MPHPSLKILAVTFPAAIFCFANLVVAQEPAPEVSVEVDWLEEVFKGGLTSVALVLLLMAGITFAVERLLALRRNFIVPETLRPTVAPMWHQQAFDQIVQHCEGNSSTMGRMVTFLVQHRDAEPGLLIAGAQDIAARELKKHRQKINSLAVVAALAPLLGLLGTMIGMIESFKLVEVYGDDGGASMLAGSISKALITTAVGLIIAIGALVVFHTLKARLSSLTHDLEFELEQLVNRWLISPAPPTPTQPVASPGEETTPSDPPTTGEGSFE